jgi:hypothetical protein
MARTALDHRGQHTILNLKSIEHSVNQNDSPG